MFCLLKIFCVLLVLSWEASCKKTNNIKRLIRNYEENLNTSIALDKNDQFLINSWTIEFQIKRVNVTTKYRMQMTRHKEHNFRTIHPNRKWNTCIERHKNEIQKIEHKYYENESNCLKVTIDEDKDQKLGIEQIGKEIRKWRRGYRYLVNLCNNEHPVNEKKAEACLVEYMQRDNYNNAIERLIVLKMDAIENFYLKLVSSVNNLEECLEKTNFKYLESVSNIMERLKTCYDLSNY